MSNLIAQHEMLLQQHGFKLVRHDKHLVYKNPENKVYVISATPSDHRWVKNAIAVLKRVIAEPPKPMVVAISEFEREQAAQLIQGQEKQKVVTPGMGRGKQRRSRGTGIYYERDEILTEEQRLRRAVLAQQAVTNKQRREMRLAEGRAAKQARRTAIEAEKQEQDRIFQQHCGLFIQRMRDLANKYEEQFVLDYQATVACRAWKAETFYEFLPPGPQRDAEDYVRRLLMEWISEIKASVPKEERLNEIDHFIEHVRSLFQQYVEKREERINKLMNIIKQGLSIDRSLASLVYVLEAYADLEPRMPYVRLAESLTEEIAAILDDELDKLRLPEDADVADVLVSGDGFEFVWDDNTEDRT